jgi:hypothetical protein
MNYLPDWPQTTILLISASQVASVTSLSHQLPASLGCKSVAEHLPSKPEALSTNPSTTSRTKQPTKISSGWAPVAPACNPSYSGDRDQEDHSLKPVRASKLKRPNLEKTLHKKNSGGVSQGVGPEFKSQDQVTGI